MAGVAASELMPSARHVTKVAYNRLKGMLPSKAADVLDTALAPFRTWNSPLNGQNARQQIVRDLVFGLRIEQFVETGTFHGTTTEFLANLLGAPVFTVELHPRTFVVAKRRLAQYPWVTVELGDSRTFLRDLASKEELCGRRTLFYLDAHWGRDLPLGAELAIIVEAWPDAVVVIDDFEVPGDPGYGFDAYDGRPISVDSLPTLPGWAILFPAVRSEDETGARRGCAVLVSPSMALEAEAVPTLRAHTQD